MNSMALGMLLRGLQAISEGAPTLLIGLLVAGVFRHMLGPEGTRRIFGNNSWRSLPQAWALGMLLPVCSLGVIPLAHEMRRSGISTGAIIAFALTAPLFNPLSLLYGFTLSTPMIIVFFTLASLFLVTMLGQAWNIFFGRSEQPMAVEHVDIAPGWQRIAGIFTVAAEYLSPKYLVFYLIAIAGNLLLCIIFPTGSLQSEFGQNDPFAPLLMLVLAIPVYSTPMTVMYQIGSMFVHGNSIGAAYALLALGTGVNLGLLWWLARQHGLVRTGTLLLVFSVSVTCIAYTANATLEVSSSVDHPHTHAFDIYSAPFTPDSPNMMAQFQRLLEESTPQYERIAAAILAVMLGIGAIKQLVWRKVDLENALAKSSARASESRSRIDFYLPSSVLGIAILVGLVSASILGCFIYYPHPSETLNEMRFVRAEALTAVTSEDVETATRNLERYDDLTRRLQVGYYLRNGKLSEFQRAKCRVLRGRLERCKDELEAGDFEQARAMVTPISDAHTRCRQAFEKSAVEQDV